MNITFNNNEIIICQQQTSVSTLTNFTEKLFNNPEEYNYYTIFENDTMMSMPTFCAAVSEIISHIGEVYSIELTEDKCAVEIWIKPDGEESALAFYLFAYDAGVVYYG